MKTDSVAHLYSDLSPEYWKNGNNPGIFVAMETPQDSLSHCHKMQQSEMNSLNRYINIYRNNHKCWVGQIGLCKQCRHSSDSAKCSI